MSPINPRPEYAGLVYLIISGWILLLNTKFFRLDPEVNIALVHVGLFGMLLFLARTSTWSSRRVYRLHPPKPIHLVAGILVGLGAWMVGEVTWLLLPESVAKPLFSPGTLMIISILVAPIVEELLFRGLMQTAFQAIGPRLAWILSGALFGIYHLQPSPLNVISGFGLGVTLAYLVWRMDSIYPVVLVHSIYNLLSLLFHSPVTLASLPLFLFFGLLLVGLGMRLVLPSTAIPRRPRFRPPITFRLLLTLGLGVGLLGLAAITGFQSSHLSVATSPKTKRVEFSVTDLTSPISLATIDIPGTRTIQASFWMTADKLDTTLSVHRNGYQLWEQPYRGTQMRVGTSHLTIPLPSGRYNLMLKGTATNLRVELKYNLTP